MRIELWISSFPHFPAGSQGVLYFRATRFIIQVCNPMVLGYPHLRKPTYIYNYIYNIYIYTYIHNMVGIYIYSHYNMLYIYISVYINGDRQQKTSRCPHPTFPKGHTFTTAHVCKSKLHDGSCLFAPAKKDGWLGLVQWSSTPKSSGLF